MSNIQLAINLKYLRKKHNLTQDDMVRILNITRQAYSNYETLNRTPDIDTLIILANYYKVNLNDLVFCNLSDSYVPFEGLSEGKIPYIFSTSEKTINNKKSNKIEKLDTSLYLSEEELDLVLRFRALTPEKQELIRGFISHE